MAERRSNRGIASELVVTEHAVESKSAASSRSSTSMAAPEDHRCVLAVLAFLRSS
jgi:hypothetical protein